MKRIIVGKAILYGDPKPETWILISKTKEHLYAKRAFIIFGIGVHWGQEWSFPRSLPKPEDVEYMDTSSALYATFDDYLNDNSVETLIELPLSNTNSIKQMRQAWLMARRK